MNSSRSVYSNHMAALEWAFVIVVAVLLASFAGSLIATGVSGHPLLLGGIATAMAALALWRFGETVLSRPCIHAFVHDGVVRVSASTLRQRRHFFFDLAQPAPELHTVETPGESGTYFTLVIRKRDGAVIPLAEGYDPAHIERVRDRFRDLWTRGAAR